MDDLVDVDVDVGADEGNGRVGRLDRIVEAAYILLD